MISAVLPTYSRAPMSFVKGEGSWLFDQNQNRYLDMGGGIAVTGLGHSHPTLIKVLREQASKLWHTSNLYHIPQQIELAEKLVEATFSDTVFFTNSGAEAMECAIKMARKHWYDKGQTKRYKIISLGNAFHGRTLGTISAVGAEKLTKGFGPLVSGFIQVPFGDHEKLTKAMSDQDVAAIIIEPIQGEGGILPVPDACMKGIRDLCDETGALLIFDEIQCGMGRTGKLFAHEWAGITPDIMAVAKGIGNGFPLGACLATERAASGMTAGTHGSTYGGNPLACAVGSAVVDIINTPNFLEEVNRKSGYFRQMLEGLVSSHPTVFELVRGSGLMLGLKCKVINTDFVSGAYNQFLLTVPGGDNVVRLLPALNISNSELKLAVSKLEQTARELESK